MPKISIQAEPWSQRNQFLWLLSRLLLADRDSHCGAEPALLFAVLAERFEAAAPSQIAVEILRCDTMERPQPFLQAAMVGVDVVDMQVGRFRSRTTRLWQNATGDRLPAGEADDRLAAVAAELVVDSHHAVQCGGDRGAREARQYGVRGVAGSVAGHQVGICSRERPRLTALPPRLRAGRGR